MVLLLVCELAFFLAIVVVVAVVAFGLIVVDAEPLPVVSVGLGPCVSFALPDVVLLTIPVVKSVLGSNGTLAGVEGGVGVVRISFGS